jgi:hypothetical protein
MSDHRRKKPDVEPQQLPPVLRELLRATNAARKLVSLYGADHPNTVNVVTALAVTIEEFVASLGRATLVFAKDSVVVNDHRYVSSSESEEMFHRLRARGVMAVTLVGPPSSEQVREFLAFLNAEPRDIRQQGGPSEYLRGHGVSRIVATEAVYTGSGESREEDGVPGEARLTPDGVDHAIAATINWLCRHDKEPDEIARLPIFEILSQPDMAARLIQEAVTKLHASRRQESLGELTSEVIDDFKDAAWPDARQWDGATPQIRKAISKLPREMRPPPGGFSPDTHDVSDGPGDAAATSVDTGDVEAMVAEAVKSQLGGGAGGAGPDLGAFESLFGARADGMLSTWRTELQPASVIRSAGNTFTALLIWANSATEHSGIAHALASLIPRALDIGDVGLALEFAGNLVEEVKRHDKLDWRSINARSVLEGLELPVLRSLVERALKAGTLRADEVAVSLVETLPNLAMNLTDLLGAAGESHFQQCLKREIVLSGRVALETLGRLLRSGSAASRRSALDMLTEIGSASAVREIGAALEGADPEFTVSVLKVLPRVRIPSVTAVCLEALESDSSEVRCAALRALGELGDESALSQIVRIATRRVFRAANLAEKIAAIEALGQSGGVEELKCLERIAGRRPLIARVGYAAVREAAQRAAAQIRARQAQAQARAA